jgi:hypothetical protein
LVNGLGILLLLLFLPEGIGGLLSTARDRLLREVARRRGITSAAIFRRVDADKGQEAQPAASNGSTSSSDSLDPAGVLGAGHPGGPGD